MASIEHIHIESEGRGFRIKTSSIPPAGILSVLYAVGSPKGAKYRYSEDRGVTFSEFEMVTFDLYDKFKHITYSTELVLDYLNEDLVGNVFYAPKTPPSEVIYDKSVFKVFFESDDIQVLNWSFNVLEKLFEPGIVPMYVSRDNVIDYTSFFYTISNFFAYVVVYARQFRHLEESDLLMKNFIEGWGIVYENINTLDKRKFLFNNWIHQFEKRGTASVSETGGVIEGEVRRLVGYSKPNEFIFAQLSPREIGWCMGYSSPMWYGTETVNAVSKGYDFGPDYSGGDSQSLINFSDDELVLTNEGKTVFNKIITKYAWEVTTDSDTVPDYLYVNRGVGQLSEYPILGTVSREYLNNMFVFVPIGTGRTGITSESNPSMVMEVYPGLDYEVNVWVKALTAGNQNIEYGVNTYDEDMNFVKQVRITDWRETNSFFTGERYQNPCLVPEVYYRLTGIVYNVSDYKQENLYLNFENGRPLRFMGGVKYMAPYIVQNRVSGVADIAIAGVTLKPLKLPFSQGYLGHKNIIAMYAQVRSARTKTDIQDFIKKYLVSYKNIVSYTWLDWVTRIYSFITFNVTRESNGSHLEGAIVTLSNGFKSLTDEFGYVRFELKTGESVTWTVSYDDVSKKGQLVLDKDITVDVSLNLPLEVDVEIVSPGFGTVEVIGIRLPYSPVFLKATPNDGYNFVDFQNITDGGNYTDNPLRYSLANYNVKFKANFDRNGSLVFEPKEVTLPAKGGSAIVNAVSTKPWIADAVTETWATVTPTEGNTGTTPITIEIV